jgi:hypothetical protein
VAGAYAATVRAQVAILSTVNPEIATLGRGDQRADRRVCGGGSAGLAVWTVRRIDASTGRS